MKKFFFCVSLALTGLMTACIDKDTAVDEDVKPGWLGGSIYQTLKNPGSTGLTGTFSYYLRLIDDLDEAETLNRTGSKTVFPANDEAFDRFFANNSWGVKSYDELSLAQKKLLLNGSMLDNALMVNMLANRSNTSKNPATVDKGQAMKHATSITSIDSIQHVVGGVGLPENNPYWDELRSGDVYLVSDATDPMMVHFTREHMLKNSITTLGSQSDFAVLTGSPYEQGVAYIYGNRIVKSDVTCMNGYMHQMEDVLVPPGNMGQLLRRPGSDTKYMSRILDYFSVPIFNQELTDYYNAWARQNKQTEIPRIYEWQYLNNKKFHAVDGRPDFAAVNGNSQLSYNPGWNKYSPNDAANGVDHTLSDIGAFFVPVDSAVERFFLDGGDGAYLMHLYSKLPNDNNSYLVANLDTLFKNRPDILRDFINNLMKPSFVETVPSKFQFVQNDTHMNMGLSLDLLQSKADGTYDIEFANNGVLYKLTKMISPDKYESVVGPTLTYTDMYTMNWAASEDKGGKLGVNFLFYLTAMGSNLAFLAPDDAAFARFYVDPTTLKHSEPKALKFVGGAGGATLRVAEYDYNPATGEVGDSTGTVSITSERVKSLFIDILNTHTIVLEPGEVLGQNGRHYYKTKNGAEIYVENGREGGRVKGGRQIDNGDVPAVITEARREKNGYAYRIDHVIQPTTNSVSTTLKNNADRFSEFYDVCSGFTSGTDILTWAGISSEKTSFGTNPQDAYVIFTANRRSGPSGSCLDENVSMFNTYDYTLYAPNNDAMELAYQRGLPRWSDIVALYDRYANPSDEDLNDTLNARMRAKEMIDALRDFTRYHFQTTALYADHGVTPQDRTYTTMSRDEMGVATEVRVATKANGTLEVRDNAGVVHVVDANSSSLLCNKMARDFWFDNRADIASSIYTSSFCAVHEIAEPLAVYEKTQRYDKNIKTTLNARSMRQSKKSKKL